MTKGKIQISIRLSKKLVKALDDELNKIDEIFYPNRTRVMEKYLWAGLMKKKKPKKDIFDL